MIDRSTPIPLYYQVAEDIKEQIAQGTLKQGEKLATEKWLTENYLVSRVTVRKALADLIAQGYVESRRGKGNYVATRKAQLSLSSMSSLYQTLTAAGVKATSLILGEQHIRVSAALSSETGFEEGEEVRMIHRLRLADDKPIAEQTIYLRERFCRSLAAKALESESLYEMLTAKCHIRVGRSSHVFSAKAATKEEVANLQLEKKRPLLSIQESIYNMDETLIEYSVNHYVPERYNYSITLNY